MCVAQGSFVGSGQIAFISRVAYCAGVARSLFFSVILLYEYSSRYTILVCMQLGLFSCSVLSSFILRTRSGPVKDD